MPPIRIVLATLPPMLGDLVRQLLSGHVDFEVIAEVASAGEMRDVLRHAGAEVVVAGAASADGGAPPIDILREHPGLRLIVMADDARVATVYELRPHATLIADVSPSELLHVIRSTTAGDERLFGEEHPPELISAAGGCTPPPVPPINPKDDIEPVPQRRP